ncbi:MAG: protein phosphatase 2C domain-containing protein [Clostridiales bacterium]|nr:protein phosphatase 2C domain-containing protein [Clostridiales bacterium]
MNVSVSYYSDIGGRDANEDAVGLFEQGGSVLAIAADGLGGHADGELASAAAVRIVSSELQNSAVSVPLLRRSLEHVNTALWEQGGSRGMKTTAAVLWFDELGAVAANVGDTRIYQFRDGQVIYQSLDHSVAQLSVLAGDLLPEEVRYSRQRHQLTRALGGGEEVKADLVSVQVRSGDAFLLCSDGFWEKIDEKELIEDLAGADSAGVWMKRMRERTGRRNPECGDNHSAIAIMVR